MIIRTFETITRRNPTDTDFRNVVNKITSTDLKDPVEAIQRELDSKKKKALKNKLPVFEPALDYSNSSYTKSNGIVHIDIDKKDNVDLDLDLLKKSITSLDETSFCFFSPNRGLKVGIQTDFVGIPLDEGRNRYKLAYNIVLNWLHSKLKFKADTGVRFLNCTCFYSYDPEIYYNGEAKKLAITSQIEEPMAYKDLSMDSYGDSYIRDLFLAVPKDVPYQDRLTTNYMVIHYLPKEAETLILSHWTVDKSEMRSVIRTQESNSSFGNVSAVKQIVLNHGGQLPTYDSHANGSKRKMMVAKQSDFKFKRQLSMGVAKDILEAHISNFFDEGKSSILRVSAGFGKTETALKLVSRISKDKKVIFFSPRHNLLEESIERIIKLRREDGHSSHSNQPVHIKGRSGNLYGLCENRVVRNFYEEANSPIPQSECNNCERNGRCAYVQQFNDVSNLRFSPTVKLFNEKGLWENGSEEVDGVHEPRKETWVPDYIVIDEAAISFESHSIGHTCNSIALRDVLSSVLRGNSVADAIRNHDEDVLLDYDEQKEGRRKLGYLTRDKFLAQQAIYDKSDFTILNAMRNFILSGFDEAELYGFSVSRRVSQVGSLNFSVLCEISEFYKNIPTLILDATANEDVAKAVYPDFEFHDVLVKPSGNIKVHQCQNASFSKAFLGKDGYLDALTHQMQGIISQSGAKSVGVITYMNLGIIKDFDELLAGKLNLPNVQFKHFGGLRGTNEFADLDLIFVVGRHQISQQDTVALAETVFQTRLDEDIENMPSPVRMTDGSSKVLSNHIFTDKRVKATYEQQCRSETIQAVMRSRPFHGKDKDVFFFSNEALGGDVEVVSFFDFVYPDMPQYWEEMKKLGFVRTERRFLKALGYTDKMLVKKARQGIIDNFIERGCRLVEVEGVTDQYKKVTHEYLVYDEDRFKEFLKRTSFVEVPSFHFIVDPSVANSAPQAVYF